MWGSWSSCKATAEKLQCTLSGWPRNCNSDLSKELENHCKYGLEKGESACFTVNIVIYINGPKKGEN